jgi:hypothetical protein
MGVLILCIEPENYSFSLYCKTFFQVLFSGTGKYFLMGTESFFYKMLLNGLHIVVPVCIVSLYNTYSYIFVIKTNYHYTII